MKIFPAVSGSTLFSSCDISCYSELEGDIMRLQCLTFLSMRQVRSCNLHTAVDIRADAERAALLHKRKVSQ